MQGLDAPVQQLGMARQTLDAGYGDAARLQRRACPAARHQLPAQRVEFPGKFDMMPFLSETLINARGMASSLNLCIRSISDYKCPRANGTDAT